MKRRKLVKRVRPIDRPCTRSSPYALRRLLNACSLGMWKHPDRTDWSAL